MLEKSFPPEALGSVTVIQDDKPLTLDASIESQGRLSKTEDCVYWVLAGSAETFGMTDIEFYALSCKGAADLTLKFTQHWKAAFRSMLEFQAIDQSAPLRLISAKPQRPNWTPSAHVTLLGDAVHAMMPAGGLGPNTALADASLLVKLIAEEGISEKVMGDYTEGMWEYEAASIQRAIGGQILLGFKEFEGSKEVDF